MASKRFEMWLTDDDQKRLRRLWLKFTLRRKRSEIIRLALVVLEESMQSKGDRDEINS